MQRRCWRIIVLPGCRVGPTERRAQTTDNASKFLTGNVNRLLVPIDFSPKSFLAIEHAVVTARIYGASLWLIHVLDVTDFMAGVLPGALDEISSRCQMALEEIADSVRKQNIQCSTLLCQGDLGEQIKQVIEEHSIDMLVLATKAGTALGGFAMASTAEHILRNTTIPVLTIADCRPVRKWDGEGSLHVFYATDLSPESVRPLEYARALQRRLSVKLTIVHVLPRHSTPEKIKAAEEKLKSLAAGTDSKVELLSGPVGPAICKASSSAAADLIVVGVKQHSLLREVLIGHTLLEILYASCCPVLTIRL